LKELKKAFCAFRAKALGKGFCIRKTSLFCFPQKSLGKKCLTASLSLEKKALGKKS